MKTQYMVTFLVNQRHLVPVAGVSMNSRTE